MGSEKKSSEDAPLLNKDAVGWGYRHLVIFMLFLGFFSCYAMRVNLSVALVAMVNSTDSPKLVVQNKSMTLDLVSRSHEVCPDYSTQGKSKLGGEFDWSPNTQGLILSSFFYGYITTQLVGGWLAERFGAKRVIGSGIFVTAVLTILTPLVARIHVNLFIILRILEGMAEGCTPAALFVMIAEWSPVFEHSKLGSFVLAGSQLGTVLTQPVSGVLCDYGFDGGWPSVFYVFGGLGCLWTLLWIFLVYESPEVDPRISDKEKDYIMSSRGRISSQKHPVPFLAIMTSLPVFAIATAHFAKNWGYFTLLTTLPTYLKQVLQFDTSQNGFLAALPYLCMGLMENIGGQVADIVRSRQILSTTAVRKLHTGLGLILPAIFLASIGFVGCDRILAVAIVTVATALLGLSTSGYQINHLDIAPYNAGVIWGIINTIGTIPGMVAPQVVTLITQGQPNPDMWRPVFFLSSGIYLVGAFVYLLFSSGEHQAWDKGTRHSDPIPGPTLVNSDPSQLPPSYDSPILTRSHGTSLSCETTFTENGTDQPP